MKRNGEQLYYPQSGTEGCHVYGKTVSVPMIYVLTFPSVEDILSLNGHFGGRLSVNRSGFSRYQVLQAHGKVVSLCFESLFHYEFARYILYGMTVRVPRYTIRFRCGLFFTGEHRSAAHTTKGAYHDQSHDSQYAE